MYYTRRIFMCIHLSMTRNTYIIENILKQKWKSYIWPYKAMCVKGPVPKQLSYSAMLPFFDFANKSKLHFYKN